MKLFIWEYLNGLTENYHDGGGAVVIAPTLDAALDEASVLIGYMADNLAGALATILRDLADEIAGVER